MAFSTEDRGLLFGAAALCFGVLTSSVGLAEEARSPDCVQAFENGQKLRKEGKLLAASESLIACSQPSCPAFIAKECTDIYTQTQNSLPSIAVSAADPQGNALTDVTVYLDGKLLTDHPDGRAVQVDPGLHELRFESKDKPPVLIKALVSEGEKNKLLSATIRDPGAKSAKPDGASDGAKSVEQPAPKVSRTPVVAYVLGGIGIAAVGTGITLRLLADRDYDNLQNTCHSSCSDSQVNSLSTKYTVSTIVIAGGAASLVTAGIVYLFTGKSSEQPQMGLFVTPSPSGSGAFAGWQSKF